MNQSIEKILTANDLCEISNQAGIYIHKKPEIIGFFPTLNTDEFNPRIPLQFSDQYGDCWSFNFIYYNNKLTADGTRNEYRLTGMNSFFREYPGNPGDILVMKKDLAGYHIVLIPNVGGAQIQMDLSWNISYRGPINGESNDHTNRCY